MLCVVACSSAVVQHVRRVHPEVADGTTETEDDDADHSYFNSKLDLPPQPATPPPLPARRPQPLQFTRQFMSRRGRRRGTPTTAPNYYSRADRYVTIVDRRERRNQLRMDKELEDRVKQLRRLTCARSRSIDEHRTMGRGEVLAARQSHQSGDASDSNEIIGVDDVITSSPGDETYPYLDHSYCSRGPVADSDRLSMMWNSGTGRPGLSGSMASDVSAFQECETMLLGLPPSIRGKGRRGRGRGRGGWSVPSRSAHLAAESGEDIDPMDPTIRDLDLLAESELLLRPAGDYSILQDILGPNCISTSQSTPASTSLRQVTSPMKSPGVTESSRVVVREPARSSVASDGGLNDSLSLDEAPSAGPSDLDDIELCEDDYRLFDPHATPDKHQPTASATDNARKNGTESDVGEGNQFVANGEERDNGLQQQVDPAAVDSHISADEQDDETRSATSEPACTSFDTETDHTSTAHEEMDEDVDVGC